MKIKLLLSALMILLASCGDSAEYTQVKIGDVIKVSSDYSAYDNADIILAWSPPTTGDGSIPRFEIDNNAMYFSPEETEKYVMSLSVETSGGDLIVEEKYYYEGVENLAEIDKNYRNTRFPSEPIEAKNQETAPVVSESKEVMSESKKKDEPLSNYFTVQIYAREIKEDAYTDLSGLNSLGFEDVFIEEFINDGTDYWRVRSGKFNSERKAEKRRDELSLILKIDPKDLWMVEVK